MEMPFLSDYLFTFGIREEAKPVLYEQLEMLVAIVEEGSMNRAADRLHITQPTLSRAIKKLEERFGTAFFERRGKHLVLTPAGRRAYQTAVEVVGAVRRLTDELVAMETPTRGPLTLGAGLTTLQHVLPPLLAPFTRQYPEIDVNVKTGRAHEMVMALENGEVDLAFIAADQFHHPYLEALPLETESIILAVPAHHPLAHAPSPLSVSALDGQPFLLFSPGTYYRDFLDRVFSESSVRPHIRLEVDSFTTLKKMVEAGLGVTFLPESYVQDDVAAGRIVAVPVQELASVRFVTYLLSPPYVQRGTARLFRQFTREFYALR